MADNSATQNLSQSAGQAKAQTEEKAGGMMEKVSSAAQSAKETLQEAGAQMQAKASDAAEAVKNATGMNKEN